MLVATLSFRSINLIHGTKKKSIDCIIIDIKIAYMKGCFQISINLQTKDMHRLFLFAISKLIYHQDFYLNILHDLSHWHKINITSKTKVQNRDKKKKFSNPFRIMPAQYFFMKIQSPRIHSCSRHLIQTISTVRPCKLNFVYCSLMNLYTRCN